MARWLSKKDLIERRKLVGHLRDNKGFTLIQIAERLGVCISTASYDYRLGKKGEESKKMMEFRP